jgi:hypothetical protein
MRPRWFLGLVACVALSLPQLGRSADAPPSIVLKVKSIDGLVRDVKYVAEQIGLGDEVKQVDEMLNSFKSEQGLGGIDTTKPIGLYGRLTDDVQNSPIMVMLPIVDEKAFLQFLGNFEIKAEKDKDGVYTVENIPNAPLPVTLYFRFANKYCYITINEKDNIAKSKLPDPKKVLTPDDSILALTFRLADMPDILKQLLLTNLENMLAEWKENHGKDESPAMAKLREKFVELVGSQSQRLFNEGETMTLRLAMDPSKDDMFIESSVTAKPGSNLAKDMKAAGDTSTLFSGIAQKTDAMNFRLTATLPAELTKALEPAVDDLLATLVKEEENQVNQALLKALLEKIAPTLKSGKIDAAMSIRGPNKNNQYDLLVGTRVEKGKAIEAFVKDAVKNLPENEKKIFNIDVAKVGPANIHEIQLGENADEEFRKMFGTSNAYLALRDDLAILAFGSDALKAIKSAADAKPTKASSTVALNAALTRLAILGEANQDPAKLAKIAKKVFGSNPAGSDVLSISSDLTEGFRIRIGMKMKLIRYFGELAKEEMNGGADK